MKKVLNHLMVLVLLLAVSFLGSINAQAGPSIRNLTETNLANFSTSPFHLNTDRYKEAFETISSYLSANDEIPDSTILIADNHGHFLHGVVTDWTYYTYGTHKGIELYVFNPEDESQFLTVEIWLPKEQQRNLEKKDSYASSFQQIENFLTSSIKYRLDLVFQDDVRLEWGKGYSFKLDDEGISLSFTVNNVRHPKARTREVKEMKEKSSMDVSSTPTAKIAVTPQATVSATASTTPTTKKKRHSKVSAIATANVTSVATSATTDDSR